MSATHASRLPGSRWRPAGRPAPGAPAAARGAAGRVRAAQRQARVSLALAAAFAAAAVAATLVPHDLASWLPLHLFLAGTLTLAISGVTVLFTVTWAAAPAPGRGLLAVQRGAVAAGAAGLAAARLADAPDPVFAAAGLAFAAGLGLLGVTLVTTVRRGVERRYDAAVTWYGAAVAAGLVAAGLGVALGTGRGWGDLRSGHVALNLLGLVGLVIGGTLPSFAATAGRTRMAAGATAGRHRALLAWQVAALAAAAGGSLHHLDALAAGGLAAYAGGLVALAALLPRPDRRRLVWAGPRLGGLWAGLGWWAAACVAAAVAAAQGSTPLTGGWLLALAVAGYGQILWASLAYLVPMLRGGGHERLSAGFAATRSWLGLAAVNAAGVALVAGTTRAAQAAVAVWVLDAAGRAGALAVAPRRPGQAGGGGRQSG